MESRSAHIVIGSFVLTGIVGIFVIGIWFAGVDVNKSIDSYYIHFSESVAGLNNGANVNYRGVTIGNVADIGIHPDDPQLVRVEVGLDQRYKIRQGDIASLKFEGITGLAVVNIEGASSASPLLTATDSQYPVIPSKTSEIEQLMQGFPAVLSQANRLLDRAGEVFADENLQLLNSILTDVSTITKNLAENETNITRLLNTINTLGNGLTETTDSVNRIAGNTDALVIDLRGTLVEINAVISNINTLIKDDSKDLVNEWRAVAANVKEISRHANQILEENREPIGQFAAQGLTEITRFLQEARILVGGLTRILEKIEAGGARFLLDRQESEFSPN